MPPDAAIVLPDAAIVLSDAAIVLPDAAIVLPDAANGLFFQADRQASLTFSPVDAVIDGQNSPSRPVQDASAPPPAAAKVSLSEGKVTLILQDASRRRLLRALAKTECLSVGEIARRTRTNNNRTSKNLRMLKDQGIVVMLSRATYALAPALRPAHGATHLDLGEVLLRLEP